MATVTPRRNNTSKLHSTHTTHTPTAAAAAAAQSDAAPEGRALAERRRHTAHLHEADANMRTHVRAQRCITACKHLPATHCTTRDMARKTCTDAHARAADHHQLQLTGTADTNTPGLNCTTHACCLLARTWAASDKGKRIDRNDSTCSLPHTHTHMHAQRHIP